MSNREEILKKIRAGNFVENNGKVIRDINLLRHEFIALKKVYRVRAGELSEQEFLDCINYLSQEGYITLRDTVTKSDARLSDTNYTTLEALVTGKGIRLLGGVIIDKMVDV